jgi:tetratricopeptide (TPR) repeat protein
MSRREFFQFGSIEKTTVGKCEQSVVLVAALWLLLHCGTWNVFAQSSPPTSKVAPEEKALLLAAEREPRSVQVLGSLGEYYMQKEKWQQSVRWLSKAYALSNSDERIGYDLAFAFMQAGELESAKRQIQQMLVRTDTAKLHSLLAAVENRRGNYVDAAKEYHRAAELEPTESDIFDLATFLLQHKKYVGFLDDSVKFFRYGVEKFPRSSQMMVGLGVALYASEQYDEAVRVFCAAVDLDPKDPRPIQFLGRASRVSPNLAADVDRRLQDFAERYPENAATNYFYALSLWERGGGEQGRNLDKIHALLLKAEKLTPTWYEPHYQLGVLYEAEERYSDAIGEMQEAVKIDTDFFPAHYRLAVLYGRTGHKSQAAEEAMTVKRLRAEENDDEASHDVTH